MKDELKNFSQDIADSIIERFKSDEFRQFVIDTKAAPEGDTGTFEVVITTENLDRYQEVIKLDGWDLANYRNNPIVLWAHDHYQPIGVATDLSIQDGKMVAKGKFAPNAKGQEIRQLYDAGIIKATSVGFIEKEREGNLITKAELLEFSFVSVPANPYALTLAMERDLSVNELVTKGFMFVEKAEVDDEENQEVVIPDDEPAALEQEQVEPEEPAAAERNFSTKQLSPVIDSLKSVIVALEALGTKSQEPEGDGDESEAANVDDEKDFAEFSAKRALIQEAATVIGDVLAEARRAIEVRN